MNYYSRSLSLYITRDKIRKHAGEVAINILKGLNIIHNGGLAHSQINLRSIKLNKNLEPLIVNFGSVAASLLNNKVTGEKYSAPEIRDNSNKYEIKDY